jgi:hypothetical protein
VAFCASLPKAMMTGATMLTPNGMTGGVPARAHSSSKIWRWTGVQPGPPYSTGQPGATQPLARQDLVPADVVVLVQAQVAGAPSPADRPAWPLGAGSD